MQRRQTKNKERILCVMKDSHAITAQDICQKLHDIAPSTIYRNLERFVADGLVREVHTEAHTTLYELADDIHDHFVCDTCRHVEMLHTRTEALKNILPKGARATQGGVVIHGVCRDCIDINKV